jgi:type IV pilus assembly protein PilV
MKPHGSGAVQNGFSMVEVMVALIVVCVGLLGVAKIQTLALASTGTAKMRSFASIEAASLAATMHADRAYWGSLSSANFRVSIESNGSVTSTQDSTLNSSKAARPPPCTAIPPDSPCSAAAIAALDLGDWADSLIAVLPNGNALIACGQAVTDTNPGSCSITLQWTENVLATDTGRNASATQTDNANALQGITRSTFVLYVDP